MHLKSFNLSWIKNQEVRLDLEKFIENLLQKKGEDLVGMLVFGSLSRNKGIFTADYRSDVDLLIISHNLPEEIIARKLYTANLSKSLGCGIHQLWHTPSGIIKLVDDHRAFFFEIIKYGKIIFEQNHFFTALKKKIDQILREKGIKELEHSWLWPQDVPGSEINW